MAHQQNQTSIQYHSRWKIQDWR